MKRTLIAMCLIAGCDAPSSPNNMMNTGDIVSVSGSISANTTWTADKVYLLTQHTFVENATLTIEAGTVVKGLQGSSLVITQTAKIDAQGTAAKPIVFTSASEVGVRRKGDWGGLVLLGKARINAGTAPDGQKSQLVEGFPATEMRALYGGNDDTHNCGTLKYVRVEFAGFELAPMKEINSLTVGGCGSQTVIDYVQTHKGSDDGVEMFGGTANLKHVVVTQANDDGLDWDFGWTGKAQFMIIQQSKTDGNHGIEADNNDKDNDAMPRSNPTLYNFTMVGSGEGKAADTQKAMLLRRGTAGRMYNFIVEDFTDFPIDIQQEPTMSQMMAGNLFVNNTIFFGNGKQGTDWDDTDTTEGAMPINEGDVFRGENGFPATLNLVGTDAQLTDPRNLAVPNWKPQAASPALVASNAKAVTVDGFFEAAAYLGAIGATDWTTGWTAYPEN